MNAQETLLGLLQRNFFLSMKLWKAGRMDDGLRIAKNQLAIQLRLFDPANPQSRENLLYLCEILYFSGETHALHTMLDLLKTFEPMLLDKEKDELSKLRNRIALRLSSLNLRNAA